MKLSHINKKGAYTLAALTFGFVAMAQESKLQAGSDKEQVVVEGLEEGEPVDITVFLPKDAPAGSYVLNGKVVTIPSGQTVVIPTGATQITIPAQTIVTIVQTPENTNPITRTYVTTGPVVIPTQTVEDIQETGGSIALIGVNADLPPERRASTNSSDEATDSNNG